MFVLSSVNVAEPPSHKVVGAVPYTLFTAKQLLTVMFPILVSQSLMLVLVSVNATLYVPP